MYSIEELFGVYPDARVIHTHRDPAKVMPSLASLAYTLRGLGSDDVDARQVGQQQIQLWGDALGRAVTARTNLADRMEQFYDVQYEQVVEDPVALVSRIYEHFDIEFRPQARRAMEAFVVDNPQGKHGKHDYTAEDFGMDAARDFEPFRGYCQMFDIPNSLPMG